MLLSQSTRPTRGFEEDKGHGMRQLLEHAKPYESKKTPLKVKIF